MRIKKVELSSLAEDPKNARVHTAKNMEAIRSSLKQFGQVEPLVVRKGTNVVIGGNGRLLAMKDLGWAHADVHEVDITDAQASALSLALNRTGDLATWDSVKLDDLLSEIKVDDEALFASLGDLHFDELEECCRAEVEQANFDATPHLGDVQFQIVVECDDEAQQRELIVDLESRGLACRVLIV